MEDKIQKFELEEVDQVEFDKLYEKIQEYSEKKEDGARIIPPDTHMSARDWVYAFMKLDSEIDRLKDEYIPALTDRYIKPVREKIQRHEDTKEILKAGLKEFLDNIKETKVNFPDVATVYIQAASEKLIYPDDEVELANKLGKDSEFVRMKVELDKKKIMDSYKQTKILPSEEIQVEIGEAEVRLRKTKK